MHLTAEISPAFTIALALVAGVVCQSVARHLRVPGIVLLLGTGVLLGPDVLDVLRPQGLGDALSALVGFAVAVILFEGGMNLNIARLRREASVIRRLITWGALVTTAGAALAAWLILGWDIRMSILFGTLVIVTGPTVITPLLRRIRVRQSVATILEAEGVLVDAIGAIVAVVALEVAISPTGASFAGGALNLLLTLGTGAVLGTAGGFLIAGTLRVRRLVPDGLENVFTLTSVLALYQLSDHVMVESGIAAVAAAGIVVGNVPTRVHKELFEFKEQLTVMLVGVLFVLLAADVRLQEVVALGWPGLFTVAALMFVVRPLNVAASTIGTDVETRERLFLAWLAPRGIVAAAVASLFAQSLADHDVAGGNQLRALVFLVIAVTVVLQGLTGGLVARALGLRRGSNRGFVILGANPLGLLLGRLLDDDGQEVVFIDANHDNCHAAEKAGFRVAFGNALEERTLLQVQIESRAGAIALTGNEEINLLFARHVREDDAELTIWVALHRGHASIEPEMVHAIDGHVLFGEPRRLVLWALRLERRLVKEESWSWLGESPQREGEPERPPYLPEDQSMLAVAWRRGGKLRLLDDRFSIRRGDSVVFLMLEERIDEARRWLAERGWAQDAPSGSNVPDAPPA